MGKNTIEIITKLKTASDGLLWMSESEYPFEPVLWEDSADLTADKLLQQVKKSPGTPVKIVDVDGFFQMRSPEGAICPLSYPVF